MDQKTDAAIRLLAEYMIRERKVSKKGEIAGAYIEIQEALHDIATCTSKRNGEVLDRANRLAMEVQQCRTLLEAAANNLQGGSLPPRKRLAKQIEEYLKP